MFQMHLSNRLLFLFLPFGAVAVPSPEHILLSINQDGQRTGPNIPLATIPPHPLKMRAGMIEAVSDTKPGAAIQARQIGGSIAGAIGGNIPLFDGSGVTPDDPINNPLPDPESHRTQTTPSLSLVAITLHRPPPSECTGIANNSNYDIVHPVNPFEVQNASVLPAPNSTFNLSFTDRLVDYNSSTICYLNTSCSIPFPGLHLQASKSNSSNSTNATLYATFSDLPSGDFISCSTDEPHMGLNFTALDNKNTTNTTFAVTLIHTVHFINSSSTKVRFAAFAVDLNAGPGMANSTAFSRSNITVDSQNNNTWIWRQAGDAWYGNVSSALAPGGWVGDIYPSETLT